MTIVVVGHGRSPEGKGWGNLIDRCCTVVRMWDWTPWQHPRDYGEKYDYGLFALTPKSLSVFHEYNKAEPSRGWLAYFGKPTSGKLPNGVPVEVIDPTPWVEVGQGLGGAGLSGRLTLTRGTVAAAWAITSAHSGDVVILVGFDNVMARTNRSVEESFCPQYWRMFNERFNPGTKMDKVYPTGQPKTGTHDMNIEAPLLFQLAQDRKVKLLFADFAWGRR